MHVRSNDALGKLTRVSIIVPEGATGPFPVLYLLGGLSDDNSAWLRWTSIERYTAGLPLIVVMPNGERGFYTDARLSERHNYESHIIKEVIPFIDSVFQTVPTKSGRTIAGLSMGGYGAFKLAMKHPQMFSAALSLSGAVQVPSAGLPDDANFANELRLIYGDNSIGSDDDILAMAGRINRDTLPELRFECGTEDYLLGQNRILKHALDSHNLPYTYIESSGDHSWKYWDRRLAESLPFLLDAMSIKHSFNVDDHWVAPGSTMV